MPVSNLEPKSLWGHFDEIRKIPHCSGDEAKLGEYILGWARDKSMDAKRDASGNVIVRIPAMPGHEGAPVVVLQGHMDMVGEKNSGVDHDFAKDPIEMQLDGEWLTAKGTTLGADNGIGLAASLAIAGSESLARGPLELLFTVDEEVGLTGAGKLEPGFVKGKLMLNLDSEELGAVYIGCSGGGDSTIRLPFGSKSARAGTRAVRLKVHGLRGGHSGIDIHEQRGNAIKILARTLAKANRSSQYDLSSIKGGNKRNAIPREAEAVLIVNENELDEFKRVVSSEARDIKNELGNVDPGLAVEVQFIEQNTGKIMDDKTKNSTLNMLLAIPHGVETMSHAVPGLVETSNNLATVSVDNAEIVIGTSSRSSSASALNVVRDRIRAVGELAGASVEENEPYPGWNPDPDSKLLAMVKNAHKKLFDTEPEVKAIHAGLECGIIGKRYSGMEMVSFGPHIEHPHSPDERVNIASVEKFWKLLKTIIEDLS